MATHLNAQQTELITEVATEEDMEDPQLQTEPMDEGSFGYITAVTATSAEKKLELIVKSASADDNVRRGNPVRRAFLREIYMYEDVLPAYQAFQRELGVEDCFLAYPKTYGSIQDENSECVILENLNHSGYKLWDRKTPMDADHVSVILKEYAKFHAVSLAMNHKKPCQFYDLTHHLTNVFENHTLAMAKKALEFGRRAVVGNAMANKGLDRLFAVVERFITVDIENPDSKIVVVHKDGWSNNFMFKYENQEDPQKPTAANIIDWQLAERGSPVLDVAYFLYTCGSIEVIINYPTHLKTYHDALAESLTKMSCNIDELYSFSLFCVQWHKYSKFGLLMAIIMIKFMLSEKDEVPNISHMSRTGMSFLDRLDFQSIHDDAYCRRVDAIITVLARSSLI